jgi:CO dehydrogenase/acetyl-CoA synthase beta subunit
VKIEEIFSNLREYISQLARKGIKISNYNHKSNITKFLEDFKIGVKLDSFKEIILQEETRLELGGINKKSFSLVHAITNPDLKKILNNKQTTLIGPEIKDISDFSVDFGMIVLIGTTRITEKEFDALRRFNFISDAIEGFLIRSIPRRFWCRISSELIEKKFSFQFLGNVIEYLYAEKFGDLIDTIEIILVNSHPDIVDDFIRITSKIREQRSKRWTEKIEEWRKRIDCEYDWGCEICPYRDACFDIKQVLVEREKIEKQ